MLDEADTMETSSVQERLRIEINMPHSTQEVSMPGSIDWLYNHRIGFNEDVYHRYLRG